MVGNFKGYISCCSGCFWCSLALFVLLPRVDVAADGLQSLQHKKGQMQVYFSGKSLAGPWCTIKTYSLKKMHHQNVLFWPLFRGPRISLFIRSGVGCGDSSCLLEWFRKGPLKRGQKSTFWWCIFCQYVLMVHQGPPEEHSMDQCRSRLKLSENFERHWSIQISGEIHMDQSLVHTFSWGNSYGPMVPKVLPKFPPTLVLVHGWLFPVSLGNGRSTVSRVLFRRRELTEFSKLGKLGEFCEELGEFVFTHK